MASNLTDPSDDGSPTANPALYPNHTVPYHTPLLNSNSSSANVTNSSSALTNPLCQLCPNDSGICCPLFAACGVDGHCPHTALVGAGYILHGMNIVDMGNSSDTLGMVEVQGRVAPGLPRSDELAQNKDEEMVKRGWKRHALGLRHGHGNRGGYGRW